MAYWAWAPKKDPNEGYVPPPPPFVARGGRGVDVEDPGVGGGGRQERIPEGPPLEPPPLPDVRPSLPLVGPDAADGPASVAGASLPNDILDRVKKATVY